MTSHVALSSSLSRRRALPARRSAFTFVEVLFAVIVLGIGFIMLAAMFPIAIQQTQTTAQETMGASMARDAINILNQLADNTFMDVNPNNVAGKPGVVEDFCTRVPAKWTTVEGNLIASSDPRFAWTAMYRRDVGAPYAQVFVFVSQSRGKSIYIGTSASGTANDLTWNGAAAPAGYVSGLIPTTLQPKLVQVTLQWQGAGLPSTVTFSGSLPTYVSPSAVNTGNFLVLTGSNGSTATMDAVGNAVNGRIYRVGNPVSGSANTFELQPGSDMQSGNEAVTSPTNAYIIGLDYNTVSASGVTYANPAPDVGIYTGFVQIH